MAISWCYGCGRLFDPEIPAVYCSPVCKEMAHRRLRGGERRAPQPRKPATLSVRDGFIALADEAGQYDEFHKRMRPKRRDLTSRETR